MADDCEINAKLDADPLNGKHATIEHSSNTVRSKDATFSKLTIELEDEDLNAPGAKKLILHRLYELEERNIELMTYRDRFVSKDKDYAVLKEKYKVLIVSTRIKNIMSIVGSVMLGFLPTLHSRQWGKVELGVVLFISAILIVAPYVSHWGAKGEECK